MNDRVHMKLRKGIGVCGILLLASFLGWRLYVARNSVELGDMKWENLGHNSSRIRCGHKTLIGPGDIELEERKDHIFGAGRSGLTTTACSSSRRDSRDCPRDGSRLPSRLLRILCVINLISFKTSNLFY